MTDEDHSENPHSDHAAHTAAAEPHPIKKNLWQRWMAWSGSFLVLSILAHVVLLGGATVLVVQVVQSRKEKMKFTAPPPSSAGATEHKVKPSKKTAAAAPAVSKRIASTAANASIALPAMDMNTSSGPDVMASVMSGLGSAGLGGGAGGAGAGGMASMPLAGLTAFGFKGTGRNDGLIGRLYDLKQTKDRHETNIKDDGFFSNPDQFKGLTGAQLMRAQSDALKEAISNPSKRNILSPSIFNEAKVINDFLGVSWDEKILQQFYRSEDPMVAYQWSIPLSSAKDAVKAFGVEKEVKPTHIVIHYKGTVTAPRDMTVRFRCMLRGGVMAVRFDNYNVLLSTYQTGGLLDQKPFEWVNPYPDYDKGKGRGYSGQGWGKWFKVQAGKKYPVEMFISIGQAGFGCGLMIEEKDPAKPYEPSEWQWQTKQGKEYQTAETLKQPFILLRYPLFALRKGVPAVPFTMPNTNMPHDGTEIEMFKREGNHYANPDVAAEPMIFPGAK
jgi:hypothetical protein